MADQIIGGVTPPAPSAPVENGAVQAALAGNAPAPVDKSEDSEQSVDNTPSLSPLAEAIKKDREARAQRTQAAPTEAPEVAELRRERDDARNALAAISKVDVVADPVGWAQAMKLTDDEIAAVGEQLLYSLAPEKADPNTRVRMLEARQARRDRLREQEAKEREAKEVQRKAMETQEQYIASLETGVLNMEAGAYPESEWWFGEDHDKYLGALWAKANYLASEATKKGQVVDLSFPAVARAIEKDLQDRLTRRKDKSSAVAQGNSGAQETRETAKQAGGSVLDTRGLGGNAAPRPPALTEKERLERAAAVAFRTK